MVDTKDNFIQQVNQAQKFRDTEVTINKNLEQLISRTLKMVLNAALANNNNINIDASLRGSKLYNALVTANIIIHNNDHILSYSELVSHMKHFIITTPSVNASGIQAELMRVINLSDDNFLGLGNNLGEDNEQYSQNIDMLKRQSKILMSCESCINMITNAAQQIDRGVQRRNWSSNTTQNFFFNNSEYVETY